MSKQQTSIAWQAPSNIALIKYWGKRGDQLPENASLSMTLKNALTTTRMSYEPSNEGLKVVYLFEGISNALFTQKVKNYLNSLKEELPFLDQFALEFRSSNSFPHSTGIASSASSMAALALCLVSLEEQVAGKKYSTAAFYQRASHLARLGSGSASRSLYGAYTTWGKVEGLAGTSDCYASPLTNSIDDKFIGMGDAVLLVSSKPKSVSSSLGHHLMKVHPFASARYQQAEAQLQSLLVCMQLGDFESFASIVENEALTLHSLLMTSSPDGLLLKPGTLEIIDAVRKFRKNTGIEVCFTLDAGPNVHLLYPLYEKEHVLRFINDELKPFCEDEKWIDDETGSGPLRLQ